MRSMSPELPSSTGVRWQPALDGERPARFCVGDQPSPRRSVSLVSDCISCRCSAFGTTANQATAAAAARGTLDHVRQNTAVSARRPRALRPMDGFGFLSLGICSVAGVLEATGGPISTFVGLGPTERKRQTGAALSHAPRPLGRDVPTCGYVSNRDLASKGRSQAAHSTTSARDGNSSNRFRPTIAMLRV